MRRCEEGGLAMAEGAFGDRTRRPIPEEDIPRELGRSWPMRLYP